MLGFLHVILTEAGLRFPGYLSDGTFGGQPIKFADVPGGAINTVLAIPGSSWAQIICPCGEDLQAERRASERPRGDAGHHGHDLARARGRGRALPDWWMGHVPIRADRFLMEPRRRFCVNGLSLALHVHMLLSKI